MKFLGRNSTSSLCATFGTKISDNESVVSLLTCLTGAHSAMLVSSLLCYLYLPICTSLSTSHSLSFCIAGEIKTSKEDVNKPSEGNINKASVLEKSSKSTEVKLK